MNRFIPLAALTLLAACRITGQTPKPATLGQSSDQAALEAVLDRPGPVVVEKLNAADWVVPLSGVLNLDDERAKQAGLGDRDEPIQIYVYALRHPQRGTFLVDSGVRRGLRGDDPAHPSIIGSIVGRFMNKERLVVHEDTASFVARQPTPVAGVFLTHLHLDHVLGLPDLPAHTPVYVGPGEGAGHAIQNAFVQGTMDRALERHDLRTLGFADGATVLDVFGDASLFALHVPGHTEGSLAFVARTPDGPVLLAGDACHTAWGWENGVEPGTFSEDRPRSASSLAALRALVSRHPHVTVHPGHQSLPGAAPLARSAAR